jgi:HK97 family phage portal protein
MNIIKRTVKKIGDLILERSVGPLKDDVSIMRSLRQMIGNNVVDMGNIKPYQDSIWVYASITTIARNLAKVPCLVVERDKPDKKVTSGAVYDIMRHPNPFMTTKLFLEAVSIFLNIYGESITVMPGRKTVTETPKELWPINPSEFNPFYKKVGEATALIGWENNTSNPTTKFSMNEILFLKYFNPYDRLRGLSPLLAAKLSIEQHYFSSLYNKNFFKQGVRTSGFITVEGELDDTTYNRILTQFEQDNAGVEKAHRVALIEGAAKFTESKFTQKDMEFIQLNRLSRTETFAAYKTNEIVLGIYDNIQSYEGIRAADKQFWEECMVPHITYIEEYLNETIFLQIEGGRYKIMFDLAAVGALHDDYKTRIDTAKIMTNMGFPLNAVNKRLELGMPDVPWGNTWFVPWGAVPVEAVLANPFGANSGQNTDTPTPPAKPNDDESDTEDDTDTEDKPSKPAQDMIDDLSKQMWNRYLTAQLILEDMIRNKIKRYLFEQRKVVIEAIARDKTKLFDIERERDKLQRLLGSLYIEVMKSGAKMVVEELGEEETENNMFNLEFPEVVKYLQIRLAFIPDKLLTRIYERLMIIFNSDNSKNVKAEEVRTLYNRLARSVGVISRNESSSVLVVGRIIQMQRMGIRYHRWISSRRVTSRSSHLNLNNKVVKIGESFMDTVTLRYPGDLMAPVHETSGCTCFTVPDRDAKN